MSKLIYVDKLKKDILALRDCYNGFSDTYDKACIIGVIDEQPTIEERKTGEWIPFDIPWYQCSECGAVRENKSFMENFCPNCGARMESNT